MSNATVLLARRSIRARFGRLIAIGIAILLAVSFVVATFVLADSLRSGFKTLFDDLTEHVDLEVRSKLAFGEVVESSERDPLPDSFVPEIAAIPGVEAAEGVLQRTILVLTADGEPLTKGGAPTYLVTWYTGDLAGTEVVDGVAPTGTEVALDKATADDQGIVIGDTLIYVTDTGRHDAVVAGIVDTASGGFGGATIVLTDAANAAAVLNAEGVVDMIDIAVADDADRDAIQQQIEQLIPENLEVVTRETLRDEANASVNSFIGPLSTGLLIFAFITAFISAFLINNVFAITIGQRLRELALLRAIGGGGAQVRRLIKVEAFLMSLIATIAGIGGGLLVARLLLAIFNSAGAGFPDMPIVLRPGGILMAFVVGVGVTLMAVIVPSRRASRIPPVAAMRPELGFDSLSAGRLVVGTVVTIVGAALFVVGIFARPGGAPGIIALGGGGALLIFLGAASVAATVAKPVTTALGAPVAKLFGAAGKLAQSNAGRAPRRTAATVSALMIGVALISAAAVFASSIRDSFNRILDRGVVADLVVTPNSANFMTGIPAGAVGVIAALPEVDAVAGIQAATVQIDGATKTIGGADADALPQLINLGVEQGELRDIEQGIAVSTNAADDMTPPLTLGTVVEVTFQNGATAELPVVALYSDVALAGDWITSTTVLDTHLSGQRSLFFLPIKLAGGVSPETGLEVVGQALAVDFPQAEVQTAEEFKDAQAAQIDQLLVIISALLGLSIIISVLGISITLGLAVFERTREIGLMRAVGMTKRQTRRMVRWEAIIVALFGALVGIVLGTLIGIALTAALPSDFVDSVSFNPGTIVMILVGAVIAGLVAALYPSAKASRLNVLEAIATE